MEYALGMIETYGHTVAIEAMDAALKASNITLPSMIHVGSGRIAISFFGDVAAVKVAVECAVAAAERVGKVLASNVIARLDKQVITSFFENNTIPYNGDKKLETVDNSLSENNNDSEKSLSNNTDSTNNNMSLFNDSTEVNNNENKKINNEDNISEKDNSSNDISVSKKKIRKKKKTDN
ncbi:BMC domain-containing protein [Brachyspira sp.]|uniref:BMC domain-containing protein n=1 Tax=Brachyspira sp. TaxID=1977261 RepID=UPI002631127B|nr:BMC domain-containing protein [Brachyspira sp.]